MEDCLQKVLKENIMKDASVNGLLMLFCLIGHESNSAILLTVFGFHILDCAQ